MFVRRLMVVGVLGVMVMIGLFLSNYSSERARYYWCAMFPIFGLACLVHELAAGRAFEIALWRILLRQALHWIGPIVAVEILFMQHARGQMATDAVALAVILLLTVTCFLARVHFDRRFYWVSTLLALAAVIGTEVETYLWFVVVLMLVRRCDRGAVGNLATARFQPRGGAGAHSDCLTAAVKAQAAMLNLRANPAAAGIPDFLIDFALTTVLRKGSCP